MYKVQNSFEVYDENLMFIRWLADVCGLDIMAQNYRFNLRTFVTTILVSMSVVGMVYSCVFYFQNVFKMLEILIILALIMQGLVKLYIAYIHRHFYEVMYDRLRDFHYKHKNHRIRTDLLKVMTRIRLITKFFFLLYCITGCSFFTYPIYTYLAERRRELLFCIRLPWIDAEMFNGYLITVCFQTAILILFVFGFTASDAVIMLFVCSLASIVDIFIFNLEELTAMMNENPGDCNLIRVKFRNLYHQHLEILEYESDLDERYFVCYFIQIISGVLGISITLFLIYKANYVPGYALLLPLFGQLLEICLLGTVLTVKNEDIIHAFYDSDWYLMDRCQQRCLAIMLHKSQHFVEMTIGGLKPLNIETFVKVMKSIYTYLMMMISLVE